MSLVAHNALPTYARLRAEGCDVLDPAAAAQQDIRALHVGLLNMMPDAALAATERQFLRLLDAANRVVQVHVHPFSLDALPRGAAARAHIDNHYERFEHLAEQGLDALIITGANVTEPALEAEAFWSPLCEVVDWAAEHVTSVFCSCLATHAVWQHRHGLRRQHLAAKCWGVFEHRAIDRRHPLVASLNTRFEVPHSRFNDVAPEALRGAGLRLLASSEEAGALLATSADGFRFVYSQGHPEYDSNSLLKEFKRELLRYNSGERADFPPVVAHYFGARARAVIAEYRERVDAARARGAAPPPVPEALLGADLQNTWRDTAHALLSNWLGKVYQLTHRERRRALMDGVDPADPFALGPPQ